MKAIKSPNKEFTLRFRRWSRAKYAVFVSLGVSVTIGFLSNSITEKSVSKTRKIITDFFESNSNTESKQNDLPIENNLFTSQLLEILISENSSEYTAAESINYFT
jgi:hypothetical protein